MKYKEILSKENIRENQIESGMVNDGRTGSIAIGLEDGVSLNLYVVSVNAAGGRSEDIIFGKLMDSDASVDDILSDRESLAEVSRQWPLFYGMLMAGVKDVYSDTAIIRLDDQLVLATKIDLDRAEHGDRKDYLGDKAALLLKNYMAICDEIRDNKLSGWRVNGGRLVRSCVEGWKAAKAGKIIGRTVAWLLWGG